MEHVQVPDIKCEGCAETVRKALSALPGVEQVTVDVASKHVEVAGTASREQLLVAIRQAGFQPR